MDLFSEGNEKSKDYIVSRLLFYSSRLSEKDKVLLKMSLFIILIVTTLISRAFISSYTVVVIFGVFLFSLCSLLYSYFILIEILNKDTGTERMMEISEAIREGSEGFFNTQYTTIFKLSLVFGLAIFLFYLERDISPSDEFNSILGSKTTSFIIVFSFFLGALCSGLSGYIGMWVSVRTNIRVAAASMSCYNQAMRTCFLGGLFAAVINIALALFGVTFLFLFIYFLMYLNLPTNSLVPFMDIPHLLIGFGFGASFVAMFAQLGGGIYTKAADVGADLIGKIEMGIPEDDPRNPAVIADLVGDNVGDCAGQAADLFESISAEVISAMILGSVLANKISSSTLEYKSGFVLFPLVIHCYDILASCIGANFVRTKEGMVMSGNDMSMEDPLHIMKKGYYVSMFLGLIGIIVISYFFLNSPTNPNAWIYFSACGIIGLIDAYIIMTITQIYTDYNFYYVKQIAFSSQTGHATNIISGLSVGLESTAIPSILITISLVASYHLGQKASIIDSSENFSGLYGTAVATMGMFVSGVFILSMSGFGPIADNAGGIIEMSMNESSVRTITDRLDAVGNITKANTKGYSVCTASLACFLLFSAYMDEISLLIGNGYEFKRVDIAIPEVFVCGLLGSAVVFLFSSWALASVGNAAQSVIKEVRRQILADDNILKGTSKPNYKQCVSIVTAAGLKEMIKPGLLSVLSPIVVGVVFKYVGRAQGKPYLGAECVAAFLMFCTSTGILMANFFNNAGGAWDNAKKYVETGMHGGKLSETHRAAVTGDTVGDPCKDTAGPSIHILIKLVSTITLVLAPLFIDKN